MPSPRPVEQVPSQQELTFFEALEQVAQGRRITRLGWNSIETVIFLSGGAVHIRNADGTLHTLIVSDGDLNATDWVIVREN